MRVCEQLADGWRFAKATAICPMNVEKGNACPPEAKNDFDDSQWQTVSIPHDFVINEIPDPTENRMRGYLPHGQGWYRLRFRLPDEDQNKRLTLLFEGVASRCVVWVNGFRIYTHEGQYTSFEIEISQVAEYGGENVLCLWVDAFYQEGWWYGGGGIYRPVWLRKTQLVCVDLWGIGIQTQYLGNEIWNVAVQVELLNEQVQSAKGAWKATVEDLRGKEIASTSWEPILILAHGKGCYSANMSVKEPKRWDIDSPTLYTLKVQVMDETGSIIDETSDRFGFRTFHFHPENGFFLNERPLKIKGVCCHQDYGLTGIAIPPRIERLRMEKLKKMGANAYRSAHNPSSQHQMDICDEIGLLVMAENRLFSYSLQAQEQLRMLIRRDRNHPCVILWSIGNEEPAQACSQGKRIAYSLKALAHSLDPSRPVTLAQDGGLESNQAISEVDVIGINYHTETYDHIHALYPNTPILASECGALGTTRGYYGNDDSRLGYFSAYDHPVDVYVADRAETWKRIAQRPFMAGMFLWSGIEHRGETQWPRLCSQSGCLDLFLQEKDAYYQTMSQWKKEPMLHLMPHWNFQGQEGKRIRVVAYTNQPEVELWLNGKSLGRLKTPSFGYAQWDVPYEPGRLEAKAFQQNKVTVEAIQETTGAPTRLLLIREEMEPVFAEKGETLPLRCIALDKQGRYVPTASVKVNFSITGNGKILATGSDVCDHNPPKEMSRIMRAGIIAVLVGHFSGQKDTVICAESDGLESAILSIPLQATVE